MLQLHVEGRAAEHNRGRCTGEKQERERPADKEHRRGIVGSTWLYRFHMRRDDAQVATAIRCMMRADRQMQETSHVYRLAQRQARGECRSERQEQKEEGNKKET